MFIFQVCSQTIVCCRLFAGYKKVCNFSCKESSYVKKNYYAVKEKFTKLFNVSSNSLLLSPSFFSISNSCLILIQCTLWWNSLLFRQPIQTEQNTKIRNLLYLHRALDYKVKIRLLLISVLEKLSEVIKECILNHVHERQRIVSIVRF